MAKQSPRPRTLRDDQRGELFLGLARTLSAGLDAVQALHAVHGGNDGAFDSPLTRAAQAVGKGSSLLNALDRNGLISAHDRPLLSLAEASGALAHACEQLAQRYQRAAVRWRQLRGKLLMPAAVLVMAIIVLPLPALVAGKLAPGDYVLHAVAMLMLLAIIAMLLAMLITHWRANGTPGWLTRLARLLPVCAPLSRLHQCADANERLALALRCGSPAHDALQMMVRSERNPLRKHTLDCVRKDVSAGATLATALQRHHLLDAAQFAIVSSAESAGRLDDGLDRVGMNCHERLDSRYALLAQWLPVLVYLCVAGVVLAGLLG